MLQIAQARYLILLLIVPLLYLFYGLYLRRRRRNIERMGDVELVEQLMPRASTAKGWLKVTMLSLAWFFFVIGLCRPQLGARVKEHEINGVEVMIALDVSNSMLAEDYSPNRLERAKLAISRLVDKLQGDRIGLIVFAGQAFTQLPITADYVSAKIFLNSISTESVPIQGTALADAITSAARGFSSQSDRSRAIILITDGEDHEGDVIQAARDVAQTGIRIYTIGVGSTQGKPIPYGGSLMKDNNGDIVVSRLDESVLQEIAAIGEGKYVHAGATEFGLNPIIEDIRQIDKQRFSSVIFEDFNEQYMYFFAIALFFLLLEFIIPETKAKRKLFTVLVLLLAVSSLNAQTADKKSVRHGNKEFRKAHYPEAEVDYKKGLIADTTSMAARYNLGNTYYKLENYSEADRYYGESVDSLSRSKYGSDLYHNMGNSLVKQQKYKEAIDAYKNALRRNPADMKTKENLVYAQKMYKDQQQNQDNNQNNDQNQDQNQNQNQNQNQDQNQNNDQNKDQNNKDNNDNNDNKQDQNQNNDQNKNNDQNQQQPQNQPQISPQAAQQMLQAMQDQEKDTQDKVKKEKALRMKSKQKEKNW